MTMSSAQLDSGLPERGQLVEDVVNAGGLRGRLMALVKLAAVGGLAFAVGLLAMVTMQSVGWGVGLLATVSGPVLIATAVEHLYAD